MINIKEVITRKDKKLFTLFPLKLYKNCKYYVPPLINDEMTIFNSKKNANLKECETVFYLAYKNDKLVGRIGAILHRTSNQKENKKYVRITRVDFIEDFDVAKALFNMVEKWAKDKEMEFVHGPLGFNDFEREGLLVEGFDQLATFEENYNYEYYQTFFEKLGYKKDVDWLEFKIFVPEKLDKRFSDLANTVAEKYSLRTVNIKSKYKMINKYKDKIFELLNLCYDPLYAEVPISKELQQQFIGQFKLILNHKYVSLVVNDKDELVGLGLCLPNIAKAVQKTKGRILSIHLPALIKQMRNPEVVDMAFFAVRPDYRTKGVTSFIFNKIANNLIKDEIKFCESTLQLEHNITIQNQFSQFKREQHKRRRCYIKKI